MYQIVYCNNPQGNHEETNSKYVVQKKNDKRIEKIP